MKLIINGQEQDVHVKSIDALLDELGIKEKVMAAAVNMNVVKKDEWNSFELKENDKVEFLQFVGGG